MTGFTVRRSGSRVRTSLRAAVFAVAITSPLAVPDRAWATLPSFAGQQIPTLAPLLRQVTPAVVNIAVRGRIREDNPLFQDPFFQQFFDLPPQLEREVQATGSA
jgi:serine protease Do